MLKGRLGLETARIPHADRAGLLWLSRGALTARDGTLSFERGPELADNDSLEPGQYAVPLQNVSMILIGPGSTVSHDALRLLARQGTALAAVGEDGVRCYTAPPLIANRSGLARRQARAWADPKARLHVARRMYAWRLGEVLPNVDIAVLRGIEGARMRETYRLVAKQVGIQWRGRRYDRARPDASDLANKALNHAVSAVEAAAAISVSATATLPQLGFIHEDPGQSFVLDIADLFRDSITIPVAFRSAKRVDAGGGVENIERVTRRECGHTLQRERVIPKMIERVKVLFDQTGDSEGRGAA